MSPNWLLYSLLIGGLMTLAAWQASRAVTAVGRASRWIWMLAGLASAGLPAIALLVERGDSARVLPIGPSWSWPATNAPSDIADLPTSPIESAGSPSIPFGSYGILLWVAGSLLTFGWVVASQLSLAKQRRAWRRISLQGRVIAVSGDFGPAVAGIRRPEIVLPEWMTSLDADDLELVLQHEAEHLRCQDSRLLAMMMALIVLMPWQVFLWLQLRGLRLSIEVDCDRRVVGGGSHARQYGELLLSLSARVSKGNRAAVWSLPLVTFWVRSSSLEQRIRAISAAGRRPLHFALPALALSVVTVLVACATRPPGVDPAPQPDALSVERSQDQVRFEGMLAKYFEAPTTRAPFDKGRVYWFVTEKDGEVVRHGEGERDLLWLSAEAYRKRFPWMVERWKRQADSTGSPVFGEHGSYVLSDAQVYQRFPDLGERRLNSYGLTPTTFGADTVMVVWATLDPESTN